MDKQETSGQPDEITEAQILQMLHRKKMDQIESCFGEKGLQLDIFVSVMLEHLEYNKEDKNLKRKLTLALIDFFEEVDVNGDETMQWEEFSNHIIELGLLRNDRSFKNVIKSYFSSDKIIDREKHETGIENLYYFQKLKNLFMLEKDSSRFKVYNANSASLLYEVNAHKGQILDLQFLEYQNLIATSSNDLTVNFWDASSFTLKQIVSVPEIQLRIRYADWKHAHKQLLYTGGSDAIIHIYDASTLKERGTISGWNPFYKTDAQQEGHSSPIGDILPIQGQQTLVSACLGGNICLWDSATHQLKKDLRGHDKGVYSLAWCDWSQMNQCLLSAGLDHQAFVWNTYVKDKIFLLRGHNHPLVGVKCLPDTPQIVTADTSGMVKIWDIRNFLCVQTFNAPTEELSSFCLTYSSVGGQPMKKRIICGGKRLHYFEYDEPKDQLLTDQKPCTKVLFNSTLLCIITMHPDSVKVWDVRNGKLMSVYRNICTHELTEIILDNRERKLFVGDSGGCIFTMNIRNGARMKDFQKHAQAVTGLAFWSCSKTNDERYQDMRRIISISMGTQVHIHDEDSPEDAKSSVKYNMKQHKKGVNSVSVRKQKTSKKEKEDDQELRSNYGNEIMVTGSDDGHTIITNLISFRHEVLPRSCEDEIKHVLFLDHFDCLLSININGLLTFYTIGQSKFRNKIMLEKQYMTQSLTKHLEAFPVAAVNFDTKHNLLLLGDEFGNIQGWNLEELLRAVEQTKVEKTYGSKRGANKSFLGNEDSLMITELRSSKQQIFHEDMIVKQLKIQAAHNDGITAIQLIQQNDAFITSSFDCCCHIWSVESGQKIGSLLLGGDVNWKLAFNMEHRKSEANKKADQLIKRLNPDLEIDQDNQLSPEKRQSKKKKMQEEKAKARSDTILEKAQNVVQRFKRNQFDDKKHETLEDNFGLTTNRLEKEFFQPEEEDSIFNPTEEIKSMHTNILQSINKKKR